MTTLIVKLTTDRAKRLAKAADLLKMTHEEVGDEALRLFLLSVAPRTNRTRTTRKKAGHGSR